MKNIKFKNIVLNNVAGISCNSKEVKENFLFAAVKGNKFNGEEFINSAIQNGAKFVLLTASEYTIKTIDNVTYIYTPNFRKDLAILSCLFFDKRPDNIIAITGTNGKTSTVHFVQQILKNSNIDCVTIGTLGVIWPDGRSEVSQDTLTSPDSIQLGKILERIKAHNINYVAMEASSHGLDQYRMFGNKINVAAFTNFSQDHLDYHKTMKEYLKAKLKLFNEYANDNTICVLNEDIEEFSTIKQVIKKQKIISYGFHSGDIFYKSIEKMDNGYYGVISIFGTEKEFRINIGSHYQLYNILCAVSVVYSLGVKTDIIANSLGQITDVPGRMQVIYRDNFAHVYVDYAHTPDALKNAILDVKANCKGNVYVVFGCGGDRDKSKRGIMGEIAAKFADIVIVTDDNPRSENPDTIRDEIIDSCPGALNIGDRREAIEYAIKTAKKGDCILIAGKGHENYQIVGDMKYHFDDVEEVKKFLYGKDR